MKTKSILPSISIVLYASMFQLSATTVFYQAADAAVGGSWDNFSSAPFVTPGPPSVVSPSGPYDQGAVQTSFGGVAITDSQLSVTVTNDYTAPPGGLLGGGDSYYIHNGAYDWNATIDLASSVTHARVSYSLVGSMGAPTAFGVAPTISGASLVESGSYSDSGTPTNTIFYYDFLLASASTTIDTDFGDLVFGGPSFPGSFRSIDGVQVEGFNDTPNAIPEPSSSLLAIGSAGLLLLLRRRQR